MNLASRLSHVRAELDYDVNDKQHAELLEIVSSVNTKGKEVIDDICGKGDELLSTEYNPLREVWKQDVVDRLQYMRDQKKNGT